jgi:hypothetical protein
MRLRRGAKQSAPDPAPTPQPIEAPPAPAPHHPDSLVYELLANVALRDLTVIERILSTISDVERGEQDPERLALYYALDHDVTRLRRSAENALVLAGAEAPMGRAEPMSLLDVARAAASESADYTRVAVGQLPPVAVGPAVADDLAHTLAELMDNALSVSPTRAKVNITGARASGGVLVAVEDEGIGIAPERLPDLNTRLTGPLVLDAPSTRQMGLYVVAHLARRHGIYVQLQSRRQLGSSAVAFLPDRLLFETSEMFAEPATAEPRRQPTAPAGPPPNPSQSRATQALALAQRPPRGYRNSAKGQVGPVRRTGQAEPPPRTRSPRPESGDAAPPPARHAGHAAPHPAAPASSAAASSASSSEDAYISPNPYTQQDAYAQRDGYAQQDPYGRQDPHASPAGASAPQDPYDPRNPYNPQDPYAQRTGAPAPGVSGQSPAPGAPLPPHAAEMLQPIRSPLPPRFGAPPAAGPPPVAPATVDRWAPSERERAQPTDFTDQGLPRRTRPSTPRAFPGPAPSEAKPADPASVLADLDAFASGAADAANATSAANAAATSDTANASQPQGAGHPVPLPPAPTRPTLPPGAPSAAASQGRAYARPAAPPPPQGAAYARPASPPPPTPAAPPPLLTDPAQEEF